MASLLGPSLEQMVWGLLAGEGADGRQTCPLPPGQVPEFSLPGRGGPHKDPSW